MRTHRARSAFLLVAAAFALAASGRGEAQEGPTSPARYLPPPGYRTKEFTLVREDGLFHLFYLRENLIPGVPTQLSFGHATSRDLYAWAEQDTILPIVPGTFEGTQMWAPTLHRIAGTWYLFYPGMRHDPANGYYNAQAISYATSPDLYTWTRRGSPLFDNTIFPWSYTDSTTGTGRDCRDPFLWWDAARGEWLMYVATRPASRPQSMVIGILGSTDLEHWSDRGQMPLSLPDVAFSDVAESPHVFSRNDSLLLIVWTTDAGQSLTFGRSTDAVTGWNTSRRLRSMLGYSTAGWWGSEMVRDGDRWYFGAVHNEWIDLWDATWTAADTFRVTAPDPFQLLATRLVPDRAAPGDTVELEVTAVNAAGRRVAVDLTRREAAWSMPLVAGDYALPDSLTLAGDTTRVPCILPVDAHPRPYLLEVRARAGTAVRDTLACVLPEDSTLAGDPPPDPEPPPVRVVHPGRGIVRFVRATSGPGSFGRFVVEVSDVRGRRLWRGEADGPARALEWRTDGRDGVRVPAGIYFARVTLDGRPARALRVALLP